jgi:TetR/AcrR family fatty acid metabolism transcriptional regulator
MMMMDGLRKGEKSEGGDGVAEGPSSGSLREAKYRRILDAAVEVIAEKGFANSRVSEIATRAGVADGTIYLYFKSKDQILMTALDDAFARFLENARAEVGHMTDVREKLRMVIRLHLETMASNRALAVVLQTELRQSAKFLAEFSQRQLHSYLKLLQDIIKEGQTKGVFRSTVPDRLAVSCLFGAVDDVVTAWVLSDREYDLLPMADGIYDLFLHGMVAERRRA